MPRILRHLPPFPTLFWAVSLGFLILAPVRAGAQFDPKDVLPSVVTCEYLDARGLSLRTTNGVLVEGGLLVPFSSLNEVTTVEAHARNGQSWSTDRLIALHPDADIALLELDDVPPFALGVPEDVSFPVGQEVTLVRGPGGSGPNSKNATLHGKFSIRGPDFLALSEGLEDGAPAFKSNGELVGICFDLSEAGFPLAYLVSNASIRNMLGSRGAAVYINSLQPPIPPLYKVRTEPVGLAFRGALLAVAGRSEDARNFLELAIKKDPGSPDAHFWMGRVYFGEQRFEAAAQSFQKAAQAAGDFHMAWHMAGASYNQASNYPKAMDMYRKALEAEPRSALTWCNIGGAEYNRQNWAEAEDAFKKAINFDSSYGLAYFNLALLYNATGRPKEAEEIYGQLKTRDAGWAQRLRSALDAN